MEIRLTLSEAAAAELSQLAAVTGQTVEDVAAARLEPSARAAPAVPPEQGRRTIKEILAEYRKTHPPQPLVITRGTGEPGCFEKLFGTLPGIGPADNESIDADLAREYGNARDAD